CAGMIPFCSRGAPRAVALVVVLCSAGCATVPDTSGLPVRAVAGHLDVADGSSWFVPCSPVSGSERLWVTFTEGAVEQVRAARSEGRLLPGERYFVHWRASVTDERHVGPGGPALLVRELLELRAP